MPGLVLLTWWALVAPVIVVERALVFIDAFRWSRRTLIDGNGWTVFAIVVAIFVLSAFIGLMFVVIFTIFGGFVGSLLGILIADMIVKPIAALAAPVMNYDLREIEAEDRAAQGAAAEHRAPPAPAI